MLLYHLIFKFIIKLDACLPSMTCMSVKPNFRSEPLVSAIVFKNSVFIVVFIYQANNMKAQDSASVPAENTSLASQTPQSGSQTPAKG